MTFTFVETLGQLANSIGRYLLGDYAEEAHMTALGWVALVGLGLVGVHLLVRLVRRPGEVWGAASAPVIVYVVGYVAVLILSEMTTMLNRIDARLLAPVFAPTVVLVGLLIERVVRGWRTPAAGRAARWLRPALAALTMVLVVAVVSWTAASTTSLSSEAGTTGLRLNTVRERAAPWIDVVEALPQGSAVVADDPYSVRWLGGHEPVMPMPGLAYYAWVPFEERVLEVQRFVTDHGGGYLVFINGTSERVVAALRHAGIEVEPTRTEAGAEVYSLTPSAVPSPAEETATGVRTGG